jgi:hypothetical protein
MSKKTMHFTTHIIVIILHIRELGKMKSKILCIAVYLCLSSQNGNGQIGKRVKWQNGNGVRWQRQNGKRVKWHKDRIGIG